MLSTRSARLAAMLLLALLSGWIVRSCRKGTTTALPRSSPAAAPSASTAQPNTFPDE